ncbi:MAG TPA: hypothetical protein VLA31_00690, partial [Burkholderiaceae bacterium]|nr:hypothetical protein [Burkholderiaceae bacterium]
FRSLIEFVIKVASTAAVVIGILWRALDKMITRKVKEQLDEAMLQLTETTSKAVEGLRQELHDVNAEGQRKADERTDRITKRIDEIMLHLTTKSR